MSGSNVNNLKLDPKKQKIVSCSVCEQPLVVGKFSKNDQTCESSGYYPSSCPKQEEKSNGSKPSTKPKKTKKKSARQKLKEEKESTIEESKQISDKKNGEDKSESGKFAANLTRIMNELGFDIDSRRRYHKRYAVDGGGVITIYPHIEPGIAGGTPKLEWFSVILQRAVGINEDFRRFMPPDAASDCEVIAHELGDHSTQQTQIGMSQCDQCGEYTDEFVVDPKRNKILCMKPNNCFKKRHTSAGAQSEA